MVRSEERKMLLAVALSLLVGVVALLWGYDIGYDRGVRVGEEGKLQACSALLASANCVLDEAGND